MIRAAPVSRRLPGLAALVAILASLLTLSGCWLDTWGMSKSEDSGSSSAASNASVATLSGTVAVGVPIVNGTVTVKPTSGSPTTTSTGVDGKYSVAVTGLGAPYALQVSGTVNGQPVVLHAVALAPGIADITPFTELGVAHIAGVAPQTWFQNLGVGGGTSTAVISSTAISNAITAVKNLLLTLNTPVDITVLGNFFTLAFNAVDGDPYDDRLEAFKNALAASGKTLAQLIAQLAAAGGNGGGGGALPLAGTWNVTISGTAAGQPIQETTQAVPLASVPPNQAAFELVAESFAATLTSPALPNLTVTVLNPQFTYTPAVAGAIGDTITATYRAIYMYSGGPAPIPRTEVNLKWVYQRIG